MKNLLKILLVLGILLTGSLSLNAKEIYLSQQTTKDYSVHVKVYDDLKVLDKSALTKTKGNFIRWCKFKA